jgi:hypothetical protein
MVRLTKVVTAEQATIYAKNVSLLATARAFSSKDFFGGSFCLLSASAFAAVIASFGAAAMVVGRCR